MKYPKQTILVVALLGLFSYQLIQPAPAEAASVLEAFAPAEYIAHHPRPHAVHGFYGV